MRLSNRMPKINNLIGMRFGKLVVLEFSHLNHRHNACWICKCDCGNIVTKLGVLLTHNKTKSCGCYRVEIAIKRFKGKPLSKEHCKKISEIKSAVPCKIAGWNKGVPRSEESLRKFRLKMKNRKRPPFSIEWRNNIGKAQLGKKRNRTYEQKLAISKKMSGEKCHLWKGGITPINKKIRESLDYKIWREAVFARDDWTCNQCNKRGGYMEAHHIKKFSTNPELRFDIDNGLTLCKPCHDLTKTGKNRLLASGEVV